MSEDSPKRIALVLNPLTGEELKGGRQDVSRVYSILTNPEQGMCPANGSTPIHDCQNREQFEKILKSILKNWDIKTQLVFYFSGHGGILGNNQYCLKMGLDNSEWYPFKNLMNELDMAGVQRAIIILDACHSGAAVEGNKNLDDNIFNSIKKDDIPQGIAIIASSRKTQKSKELPDGSSGLFTDIFCTGIETSLDGKGTNDGKIYVEDIVSYINNKLETEEKYSKFPQRSVFHLDRAEKKIWIAQGKKKEDLTPVNFKSSHSIRTPEELKILYEQTDPNRHPCPEATIEDIDLELLEKYANKVEPELYKTANLEEVLWKLKLYSRIQDGGRNVLHKSAVLCFHKRPEMIYSQARSVFIVGRPRESSIVREDIRGPLSSQVKQLVEKVKKYTESISYIGGDGLSHKVEEIDIQVARELISNAIAHRDYQLEGTVKVSITPEALEVYSPGRFLPELSWNQLIDCIAPISRPVDEAISFYLLNLAFEGIGRGFDIFKEYIKENGSDSIICRELPGPTTYIRLLRRTNRRTIPDNKNIVNQYKEKVQTSTGIGNWINKGREFYKEKIEPTIKDKVQPSIEESVEKARKFYQEKTDPIKEEVRPFLKNEDFSKLEAIIHTASVSAAAASGALAQGAAFGLDTPVLITIHIGMVIQLGEVFGRKLNKNTAAALLGSSVGVGIGAFGVKAILGFIPFAGNLVNATVSFGYTELLGWTFVKLFKNDEDSRLLVALKGEGIMGDTYNIKELKQQGGAVGRNSSSDNNYTFYHFEEKQSLAEAAEEIQQLLKQLEETNPTATEDEKIAYVNIATTPSLKGRVVGALQAGGEAAIEEVLDNSYVNTVVAIFEGWAKPE
ncbi:caspase family protein [Okeania sp. KiyG1]|uniref:caspase family protein n=1 Tax=Okeania sp. KiyG1 TaxID=2720165 RepID=UPI001920BD44|nr:caspase family protein [Okeania sp. KiyG1]GGA43996.1 hypothetical protein CYANOKiyG1_62700 [Okeania sp. KiyG1]